MYKSNRIAVVMPIYNEAAFIAKAVSKVPLFVDLIIAVDDGSTDTTWKDLSLISRKQLIRVKHEKNHGVGAATKTGYAHCLEADVDLIAVMDGDGMAFLTICCLQLVGQD